MGTPGTSTSRLTRHDYYTAAMRILAASSAEALTINALCEELRVSKGSFYHHFGGWPGFVDYLLETWEQEYTLEVKRLVDAIDSVGPKIRLLSELISATPHDAEASLRVWSFTEPKVKATVERVDRIRVDIMENSFARIMPEDQAALVADLFLAVLVHMQLAGKPVDTSKMAALMQHLKKLAVPQPEAGGD